jgi:hypothetical protein
MATIGDADGHILEPRAVWEGHPSLRFLAVSFSCA